MDRITVSCDRGGARHAWRRAGLLPSPTAPRTRYCVTCGLEQKAAEGRFAARWVEM